jgi:hypothetical protein
MGEGQMTIVPSTSQPQPQQTRWKKTKRAFKETIAILFWVYAVVKLFIFDIDVYLLKLVAPNLIWVLDYKLPVILAVITLILLATRSLDLGLALAYIALYPFIVLLWKLPWFVWKQKSWLLAFAVVNALMSFFYSFRRDFIAGTVFLISAILILNTNNFYTLVSSAAAIAIVVVFAYYVAFRKALMPSAVFQTYKQIFPAIRTSTVLELDTSLRNLPVESMTQNQIELRTNSLQNVVLFNRVCLFLSKKLRDYQRSGLDVVSYIFSLMFLLIFTIFAFGLINYALFKLDSTLYQFTYSQPSPFAFLYYSGGSMFYASNGLVPTAPISQAVQLVQFLCGVLLLVILITVFFTVRSERHTSELDNVISSVESEGHAVEAVLQSQFNLNNIDAAISALQQAKAGLTAFIIYLTKGLAE